MERRVVVDSNYVMRNGSPYLKVKTYEITYRLYDFNEARGVFTGPSGSWEVATFYVYLDRYSSKWSNAAKTLMEHIANGDDEAAYSLLMATQEPRSYQEGSLVFRLSDEGRSRAYMVAEAKVDTYDRDEWESDDWDDFIATDPAYWIRYASQTEQEKPDDLALQDFLWTEGRNGLENRAGQPIAGLSPEDYELVDYDGTSGYLPENIAAMLEQEGFQLDPYATETISPIYPRAFNFMA